MEQSRKYNGFPSTRTSNHQTIKKHRRMKSNSINYIRAGYPYLWFALVEVLEAGALQPLT
jgi:hypothetical protein